jgi:two-component system sensor histidine kinase CreC
MKLRQRILLAFLFVVLAGGGYMYYRLDQAVRPVYLEALEDDLVEFSSLLAAITEVHSSDGVLRMEAVAAYVEEAQRTRLAARIYGRTKTELDFRVYATNGSGWIIYSSHGDPEPGIDYSDWNDVHETLRGRYGARATWETHQGERRLMLYVASPIKIENNIVGTVTVGKPTALAYNFYQRARDEALLAVLLVVLLVAFWGWISSLWVTRPIQDLIKYARLIRDGGRPEPPRRHRHEIGELAETFEEMRDALEGKRYIEQFVQTLTHEIKSPLSAIRGAAELIDEDMPAERRQRFMSNILNESTRIQRIVERLLELSNLENRKGLRNREWIAIDKLLQELLSGLQSVAETKQIRILWQPEEAIEVQGERFLLHLALSNLLQNALDFTPTGGTIEISFLRRSIRISDSGPGVPEYAQNRVFDNFYSLQRPGTGRKSSGLGLSIVRQVAELHHGGIDLRNRETGQGAQATLWFPVDAVRHPEP